VLGNYLPGFKTLLRLGSCVIPFAKFIKSLKTNQDKDEITPEVLRKIRAKHASMVHAGPNPTP